jgi:enhancing lycopene biosynthesis protein 2
MGQKIAIILSGCGVQDGSEIHEAVMTLLAVVKAGATPLFFAPDVPQRRVVNHLTKEPVNETRNVLVESARIARGEVKPLAKLTAGEADAVIFPGGFGAALNLCDFAEKGPDCAVNPDVARVVKEFHAAKKPIGALCIAPALLAKVLGAAGVQVTIGTDAATAAAISKTGANHVNKHVDEILIDEKNRVVTTACYMHAKNIAEVEVGASKVVEQILKMI